MILVRPFLDLSTIYCCSSPLTTFFRRSSPLAAPLLPSARSSSLFRDLFASLERLSCGFFLVSLDQSRSALTLDPQSESLRLVLIQILLQGHSLDPLTSLHHYAPVCLVLNLVLIPLVEGPAPFLAVLYPPQGGISIGILLANAAIAFSLNLLGLILIQRVGGLVLSLAGVVKDIALIIGSAAFFGNEVRSMQIAGGLLFRALENKALCTDVSHVRQATDCPSSGCTFTATRPSSLFSLLPFRCTRPLPLFRSFARSLGRSFSLSLFLSFPS